jgi:hypothetical protein
LVAGDFTGDGRDGVAVLNQGTHSFTVLAADGNGGFASPLPGFTTSTSGGLLINDRPVAIVAGDFNRDNKTDLAVLMEDTGQLWIYTGNGNGTFRHSFSIPVGAEATGLSVVPGSGNGVLNLLVGNGFGDVLTLEGKGDGTFQIQGRRVSLAVVPNLLGPGQAGVLVGDQQNNRVTVQAPSANGTAYTQVQSLGSGGSQQMAPGDVEWAVLDRGATLPDAIVVGTGSNSVAVYRTLSVNQGLPTFSSSRETYFVGTAPTAITVADINGDGIPDMLVADQGSNDVSVIFGSFNADGDWVGIPGPRLKSGGDGPSAVIVRELTGNRVPDLAVVNGGSGTVTLLPAVGGGFFDDQRPRVLFNLGSAVAQAPTFTGDSGLGYAVTANGNLVRFDLDNPQFGANVVYSGGQVVAAQALPSGQVVAALADGIVDLLAPKGNFLAVESEFLSKGGTPALPSAIDVVNKANGLFDVLVTSEGSDTIYVFDAGAALSEASVLSGVSASAASLNSFQSFALTSTQVGLLVVNTNATSISATAASTSTSGATSAVSLSAATIATGLSLGTFSSLGNGPATGTGTAVLVSVEGNTYLSVPILGLGTESEAQAENGMGRMPWLSSLCPFGDTSAMTRFIIGLDEALREYRGFEEKSLLRQAGPSHDPWNEDLFHQHLPVPPPVLYQEPDDATGGGNHGAMAPDRNQNRLPWDDRFEQPDVRAVLPPARMIGGLKALGGVLSILSLLPTMFGRFSRGKGIPDNAVSPKATREADS